MIIDILLSFFFFFNDTATTEIYTLSLHDALPIFGAVFGVGVEREALRTALGKLVCDYVRCEREKRPISTIGGRSEEHTSELQSRLHLVCRLLLEKKKKHE